MPAVKYKVRPLKTADIFAFSRVLKKLGLKLDFNGKSQEQVGGELLLTVFENLHMAQEEASAFLGDLVGLSAEEFQGLPIEDSIAIVTQVMSIPGITGFFKRAG